jgi:MFS family permease
MSASSVPAGVVSAGQGDEPGRRRWFVLGVVGLAQLMIVLDITVMNIALPSAQAALHFSDVDRQWVITGYALAFGSLLLLGGRLGDLFGRKVTFLTGLTGFALASAVGGASTSFTMLITARACQGAFAALLAPARWACSPRRSAIRGSGAGRSACTGRSRAGAGWWACCSAVC